MIRNGVEAVINVKVRCFFLVSHRQRNVDLIVTLTLTHWQIRTLSLVTSAFWSRARSSPLMESSFGVTTFGATSPGATGESDAIRKAPFEECWAEHLASADAVERGEKAGNVKKDPFVISGSKIMEGVGAYVVVAVGERSFHGRIMMGTSVTPLFL